MINELEEDDELIVVDNASEDGSAELVRSIAPRARLIEGGGNVGFAAGCNIAAAEAGGDLLVILNPDAAPASGWGGAIRRPWEEGRGWSAWQGLITEGGGRRINSAGNPIHFTGIVWAGLHGRPVSEAPRASEVPTLSGACLAIPRETWNRVGGFAEDFFLYCEDVDLSLRLRVAGGVLGIEPAAVVDHDYEFDSSDRKWRWLERNRIATVIRTYPAPLLLLLAPALLATEVVLLPVSIASGWGRQKLAAHLDVIRRLPRLLGERRSILSGSKITAGAMARWMTADLSSPIIPAAARSAPVRFLLGAYWRGVRMLLG